MHVIQIIFICASIYMPVILAQTNIWYEQMNTSPILSWAGATPTVLTNDAACPDPYTYCWSFTTASSISYSAPTIGYTNVQLTYFVAATKINSKDKCIIDYSVDTTNWNVIREISSNTAVTTETYSSWQVTVDDIAQLTIRLTYSGTGHNCYFTEFVLKGIPTPQSTNAHTNPTQISTTQSTFTTQVITSQTDAPLQTVTPSQTVTSSQTVTPSQTVTSSQTSQTVEPSQITISQTDATSKTVYTSETSTSETVSVFTTLSEPTQTPSVSTELDLKCSANECANRNIQCPSNTCSIYCEGSESCSGMIVHASNTSSVSVGCAGNHACIYMSIYATEAGYFTLNCHDAYSCNSMEIVANFADVTFINAASNYALSDSTVFASVYEFQVSCASKSSEYACVNNDWYLPMDYNGSNIYINCYGDGCKKFGNVYMDFSVSELKVNIYGCGECVSSPTCIEQWTIHCYDLSSLFPFIDDAGDPSCIDDAVHLLSGRECDCGVMQNSITYIDDIDNECIITETIEPADEYINIMDIVKRLTSLGLGATIAIGAAILCVCCMFWRCCCSCCSKKKYEKPINYQGQCMTNPDPAPITMIQPQPQPPPALQIVYVQSLDSAPQQQPPLDFAHVQQQPSWDIAQQQPSFEMAQPEQPLDISQQQQQGQQPQVIEMQTVEDVMQGYNESIVAAPYAPSHVDAPPEYEAVAQVMESEYDAPPAYEDVVGVGDGDAFTNL